MRDKNRKNAFYEQFSISTYVCEIDIFYGDEKKNKKRKKKGRKRSSLKKIKVIDFD